MNGFRFWVFLLLTAFSLPGKAQQTIAQAEGYPNKPVRWIVAVAPGGFNDILARVFSAKLSQGWGQQFIIDNRPGAGGMSGAHTVRESLPDGYTLLLANAGPSVNVPLLSKHAPYKVEDFTPIIYLGYAPLIIVANPSVPVKDPKELLSYLKANSIKINWGSSGIGSPLHIGLALLQSATGIQVTHVAYKGAAQALTDLTGGTIQLMHATTVSAGSLIKAGRIKVIGVASNKRSPEWPDVLTLEEGGIANAESVAWFGISAPPRTSREIVNKINMQANKMLSMPDVKQRLDQLGVETVGGSPSQFSNLITNEAARLSTLINSGILQRD